MIRCTVLLGLWAGLAQAQDSVPTNGELTDDAFYQLVACAAPPGGDCAVPSVRWASGQADDLTVALTQIEPGFPADRQRALTKALYRAIDQINATGAGVHLRFGAPDMADISVHMLNIPMGGRIDRTGLTPLDGSMIQAALVQLWWDGNLNLTRAAIVFPQDIEMSGLASIALEELTQALGLRTDIDNRWYERRSVFSETSNSVTQLGEQDIMAIRRHYPQIK